MEMSSSIFVVFCVVAFAGCYLLMSWLDQRYGWQLVAWCNGEIEQPFMAPNQQATSAADATDRSELEQMRQRIEVLEKIVTEPAYELNEKLRRL